MKFVFIVAKLNNDGTRVTINGKVAGWNPRGFFGIDGAEMRYASSEIAAKVAAKVEAQDPRIKTLVVAVPVATA